MCYSVMVEKECKNIALKMGARVDNSLFEEFFELRAENSKLKFNRALEEIFYSSPKSPEEKRARELIESNVVRESAQLERELFKQSARYQKAEKALKRKESQKAQNEVRISKKKIAQCKSRINQLKKKSYSSQDYRIYPFSYVPMLFRNSLGELTMAPFRYHLRPNWAEADFDRKRQGCYNARKESLNSVWKAEFGSQHGLLFVKKFYENVWPKDYAEKFELSEEKKKGSNLILEFEPEDSDYMVIPTIWDCWQRQGEARILSCALITREPPPEIAETGHDRCPVFLKQNYVDEWLRPKQSSSSRLMEILNDPEIKRYSHQIAA